MRSWGTVTKEIVRAHKGSTILNFYEDSMWKMLNSVYPGIFLLWKCILMNKRDSLEKRMVSKSPKDKRRIKYLRKST